MMKRLMKKIYVLPLLVIFAACSADNNEIMGQGNAAATSADSAREGLTTSDCFTGLAAHTVIDASAGFGNPVIDFIADVPAGVPAANGYAARVEIQPLADCEDLHSDTGSVITITGSGTYYNVSVNAPMVPVLPAQTAPCYKWRMVLQKITRSQTTCISYTNWYDAPLF